jgi:acyl-coenzyme A thioesterase PaaI-like protein
MSRAVDGPDMTALGQLFATVPYARFLGIQLELKGNELTAVLPFKDSLVGNPVLPALHGGVIGAMMELAAVAQIVLVQPRLETEAGEPPAATSLLRVPKPIDISIDYLRSGRPRDTYARAHVTKLGRRVANVRAEAWQADRGDPIATLHGHFLLYQPPDGPGNAAPTG